jgi:hypothetical protein
MRKLILRLLAVILSVYLAGSIYPLFATEDGHSHGPAPSGPPPPPPTTPSAPPMLDTKLPPGPQLSPPRDMGGGCCGGATQPTPSHPMVTESPPVTDVEQQQIQEQINQLEAQAATYTGYADQYDRTADELAARVKSGLTAGDDQWLESHTAATATGYRGPAYGRSPDIIKKEMDDFEKLHAARDTSQSGVLAIGLLGGKKGLRRAKFLVEIARTREFANQLRQKAQECQQKINELKSQLR